MRPISSPGEIGRFYFSRFNNYGSLSIVGRNPPRLVG